MRYSIFLTVLLAACAGSKSPDWFNDTDTGDSGADSDVDSDSDGDADAGEDSGIDTETETEDTETETEDVCADAWSDADTGLMWENPLTSSVTYGWDAAVDYCNGLTHCGFDDWRLPSIGELRSLIRDCPATVTDGACLVADTCLAGSCWTEICSSCTPWSGPDAGCYWPADLDGDCNTWYWSGSTDTEITTQAWVIAFHAASIGSWPKGYAERARCVRTL